VVSARARLDPDYTWRLFREEGQQISAAQTTPKDSIGGYIDTVHLKNGLGDIEANRDDGHSGSSPPAVWNVRTLPRPDAERGGAVHAIKWLLQHRYMQIEGMAELTPPLIDADPAKLPPMAA
jgi:hypothetical protein